MDAKTLCEWLESHLWCKDGAMSVSWTDEDTVRLCIFVGGEEDRVYFGDSFLDCVEQAHKEIGAG